MNPTLTALIAQDHLADLRRTAERRHPIPVRDAPPATPTVELRPLGARDVEAVVRLAALDEAPPLESPALVALVDGQAVAALSLVDGRAVANPFVRTAHAIELLRLRAEELLSTRQLRRRGRRRWRLPRLRLA